ncbi:hypothetical protein FRC07_003339 [Ceratobasidium sp. 392]|nr:hypothetical protein FRC07_003339 [Ceratobasidium sp. 392]
MYIQRIEAIAMHEEYLEETGALIDRAQQLAELSTESAKVLEDDDWDEWEEEDEEEEDEDELNDAGIKVEIAVLLDEFLDGKRARVGGQWQQENVGGGEHADQGPPRFHPVPEIVVAKTPTDTIRLDDLEKRNDAPRLYHALDSYLQKTNDELQPQDIRKHVTPTTKVHSWSRARLFHSPPPFKPSEGPHIDVGIVLPASKPFLSFPSAFIAFVA